MLKSQPAKAAYAKVIAIIIFSLVSALIGYTAAKTWHWGKNIFIEGNPIKQLASFVFDESSALAGERNGQVNVLLLGIGGEGHDGPYLSDTIIVVSIKPENGEVSMLSIPRDFLVELPKNQGRYKINHAYALGVYNSGTKAGLAQARKVAENLTGMDIPYGIVVDFQGFVRSVDHLDGLDVEIEETFTDYAFPNNRHGYLPPVTFKKGVEHMDGTRALIFARSRYSTSDFSRSRRQQKILEAFNQKLKDLHLVRDIGTINKLMNNFANHVVTNLSAGEIKRLMQAGKDVSSDKMYTEVLDPTTGIVCSYYSYAYGYHLQLCPGRKTSELHTYVSGIFARARVQTENPVISIRNTTFKEGLATSAAGQLNPLGVKANAVNANLRDNLSQTIIYDLTGGQKPNTLAVLLNIFGAQQKEVPVRLQNENSDFIVMLGQDYQPPILYTIEIDPIKRPDENKDKATSTPENADESENSEQTNPDDESDSSLDTIIKTEEDESASQNSTSSDAVIPN